MVRVLVHLIRSHQIYGRTPCPGNFNPRHTNPGDIYHLISRFVDREWFISNQSERKQYIELLGRALDRSDWRCLAYAVMSNHIHLNCVAGHQSLDSWIRRVHSPFADWMNRTHERIGSIFVRGPKQILVPVASAGRVIAYIHNNPVRARVVTNARDSKWTSHRFYVGLEPAPRWLHVAEGLALAGLDNRDAFDAFVADRANADDLEVAAAIEEENGASNSHPPPLDARVIACSIVSATARELEIPTAQLCSRRRGATETFGREVAVYCARAVGVTGAEIARALCMSQQGVSVVARRRTHTKILQVASRIVSQLDIHTSGACSV
jgi:hypothetical protein